LFFAAASTIAQHYLLGVRFLTHRTALFFLPLYAVHVICLVASMERWRGLAQGALAAAALLAAANFIGAANTTYSIEYKFDASTERMAADLSRHVRAAGDNKKGVRLACNALFYPSVRMYREMKRLDVVSGYWPVESGPADYYYLLDELDGKILRDPQCQVLERYPLSGACLVKRTGNPALQDHESAGGRK